MTLLPGFDQAAVADTTVALVAQPPTEEEEPGGRGEDFGKSSPVGLLVILLFFVAVAFLVRSMTKHLKRVPESFDKPDPASQDEPDEKSEPAENGESDSAKS